MKYPIRIILIALMGLMVITQGCQQDIKQTPKISVTPLIKTDCIVYYFRKDNAPYITQQQHNFDPAAGYLEIVAREPSGQYIFTLKKEDFNSTQQLTPFLSGLPASFINQNLATSIFYSFVASSGILDTDSLASSKPAVKLEGQWYKPIGAPWPNEGVQVNLLENLNTNQIDRVELNNQKTQTRWMALAYNHRYSKELNTIVPRKIDIFDIQDGLASKKLIIQFDYKNVLNSSSKKGNNENISGN